MTGTCCADQSACVDMPHGHAAEAAPAQITLRTQDGEEVSLHSDHDSVRYSKFLGNMQNDSVVHVPFSTTAVRRWLQADSNLMMIPDETQEAALVSSRTL